MSQRNRKRKFLKIASTSLAIGFMFLAGCSTPNTFSNPSGKNVSSSGTDWNSLSGMAAQMNSACSGGGMGMPMMGCLPLPSRTFDATASGKTEVDVDLQLCRDEKGTCKDIYHSVVATFSGVSVPIESVREIPYISEIVSTGKKHGVLSDSMVASQDIPAIATTGFSATIEPAVLKNGQVTVGYTVSLSALKEMETSKRGVQMPVIDKLIDTSGFLNLGPGGRRSVLLGNGFHMTVSAKVLADRVFSAEPEGDNNPFLIDQSDKRLFGVDPPKGGPYLYCNGSCIVTPMRPPACYLSWFIKMESNIESVMAPGGFRPMSDACVGLTSVYEKKVYQSKKNYRQITR